jgi:phage terminase large subunit GpA-like protein
MSLFTESEKEDIIKILQSAPVKRPNEDIAAYIEGRRVLPLSTPIPGAWRNSVTPYGIEIMNSLSPNSGIQVVTVRKCRKCGLTTLMENVMAYYMLENPSVILYATASEDLARDWGDNKIIPVIESLGGLDRITANTTNTKSRRSGNTSNKKEYIGGLCYIMSSQSKRARRQLDVRCLFIDEIDAVEAITATGEGKWTEVLFGHTMSWGSKRKIALFGSPTEEETSLTNEYHLQGDCRRFMVPCPYCGELIELNLDLESGSPYGLKADTVAGEIKTAYYICERCGEAIFNEHKISMYSDNPRSIKHPEKQIEKYQWQPTKKPADPTWRSYQLNALYSPIGMLTFTDVAKARKKAEEGDDVDMRSYVNIYVGKAYKSKSIRPKLNKVLEHRGVYTRGKVPDGVLFLTMACDVQRGSENNPDNPPRIELEIMGTGAGYKTWSIEYRVFSGSLDDPYDGAWEDLFQYMKEINGTFYNKNGFAFQVKMIGIDSGDAAEGRSEKVYRFCERWTPFAYPIKGFSQLMARRHEKADIPGAASFKKYRMAKIGSGGEQVLEVSTAYYKDVLFGRMNINATADNPHPNGYCDFPADYPDDYFVQLTNSEKLSSGGFKDVGVHEALDCRVYNLCLSDAWLEAEVRRMRDEALKKGADSTWVQMSINSRTVLEQLQAYLSAYAKNWSVCN